MGALTATMAVTLPTYLFILILSYGYFTWGEIPTVNKFFQGFIPAVTAIIATTVWNLGRKMLKGMPETLISIVACGLLVGSERGHPLADSCQYVDFGFTYSGWDGSYVFLELKQNNDYKKCIDMMFKDAEKYEVLKSMSMDGLEKRNVFVVGMFKKENWDDIQVYFDSCMEHYEFEFDDDEFMFLDSKSHKWGMLIF